MLPVVWSDGERASTRYANQLVVQYTADGFVLTFYDLKPPITVGSPEEQRAQAEAHGSLHPECVARILVHPARMKEMATVLAEYVKRVEDGGGQ